MGTYRQPASLVDTQSGKISREATQKGFDAISKMAAMSLAQAEKREKQEKEMEAAEKRIWEAAAIAQAKGNALLDQKPIDGASLGTGINNVINEQANARIENLRLSTSDPRYQENLKIIGSTQQFIEGLPSMLEGGVYMESMMQDAITNGVGYKPNQIAFGSMTAAELEANSQTNRVDLGWATSFETVKDENGNWGLYTVAKKGDETVRNAINYIPKDEDGSTQYNFGTYRIVPDASRETKTILIKDKTFKSDGTPSDQYLVKTQETIGSEVYDITRINTDQLLDQSNIPAGVLGEKIIRNGTESMVDYMQSKGILDPNNPDPKGRIRGFLPYKVDANGNVVKENGKVVFDEWVQVTDDNGQFVQDATQYKANTGHLSDEQYDKFMQFVQVATAADNGVLAPEKRILDGAATERLKKSMIDMTNPPNLTDKQETQNFNLTEINKYKERQLDELPWGQKFKVDEVDVNKANTMLAETLNGLSYVGDLTGTLEVKYVEKPGGIGGKLLSGKKAPLDGFIEVYRISNTKRIKEGEFKLSDGRQMESFDQYLNKNLYGKVGSTGNKLY